MGHRRRTRRLPAEYQMQAHSHQRRVVPQLRAALHQEVARQDLKHRLQVNYISITFEKVECFIIAGSSPAAESSPAGNKHCIIFSIFSQFQEAAALHQEVARQNLKHRLQVNDILKKI